MDEEARYYLSQCCGVNAALKLSSEKKDGQDWPVSVPTVCIGCEKAGTAEPIERWKYERITAPTDDCKNCANSITFIPDRLEWVHEDEDESVSEFDPLYGIASCQTVVARLLGVPRSFLDDQYSGLMAEPADSHTTVDLQTGATTSPSQEAFQMVTGNQTTYNPRISSQPGEPLEIEVDLPDNASSKQVFEAMEEAIEKIMPGFGKSLG